MNKQCTTCKEIKDLDNFSRQDNGLYGVGSICKPCKAAYARQYKENNRAIFRKSYLNYRNSFNGFLMLLLRDAREHIKNTNKEFSISKEFLKELWNKQKGLCAFTGHPLEIIKAPNRRNPYQASLDRIDSSKGYTKDNVRWVCWFINYMKQDYSEEEFIHLIKLANSKLD